MKRRVIGFFLFLFLVLLPVKSYAADFKVSGKLIDQKNNPIPQGTVVFITSSGKTVTAATTDFSGAYEASVPLGTYAVSASGPKGAEIASVTLKNQKISSSTTFNFTLTTPTPVAAKKPSFLQKYSRMIMGGILLLCVIIAGFIFWRKKHATPKSPSEVSSV